MGQPITSGVAAASVGDNPLPSGLSALPVPSTGVAAGVTFAATNPTTLAFGEEDAQAAMLATQPPQMSSTVPGTVSAPPQVASALTYYSPAAIDPTDVAWRSVPTSVRSTAARDQLFADWGTALLEMV
jgi:hypothetical protein